MSRLVRDKRNIDVAFLLVTRIVKFSWIVNLLFQCDWIVQMPSLCEYSKQNKTKQQITLLGSGGNAVKIKWTTSDFYLSFVQTLIFGMLLNLA